MAAREGIVLRRMVVGLGIFLVGTGFGYCWHYMAG